MKLRANLLNPLNPPFSTTNTLFFFIEREPTGNPSAISFSMAPNNNKRRASQASEETPQQNKKNKVARESTPATVGQSNPAASPTRGKNSQVNQTVIWVRDPPADTIPIKDIPWLQDNIMDLFTQVKVTPTHRIAGLTVYRTRRTS